MSTRRIGWKKIILKVGLTKWGDDDPVYGLAKLLIPKKARVIQSHVNNWQEKIRCSEAKVLAIYTMDGQPRRRGFADMRRSDGTKFTYTVGKTVRPEKPFDPDSETACASGIHFFDTEAQARGYRL